MSTMLTIDDVKKIVKLAKLNLTDQECDLYQKQLADTLTYIQQLKRVDTKNVEATAQVTGLENVFREDEVKPSLTQKQALLNVPNSHRGFVMVKSIFEDVA